MISMPTDLALAAEQNDDALATGLASAIPMPVRPYKAAVVVALAKALADLTKLMGAPPMEDMAPKGKEDLEELPLDMVRLLGMAMKAAEDYGQPLPVSLEAIRSDSDLTMLAAAITELVKDRDFRDWLKEDAPEPEAEEEMEGEMEEAPPGDDLFRSRMGS
jgi:hypothetical protein